MNIAAASKKRYGFIDALRGLCVVLMIGYHAMYDAQSFFSTTIWVFDMYLPIFSILQPLFAGLFIIISGLCCGFSKNNGKRGLKLLAVSYLLTLVTRFLGENMAVYFGILHCLGFSMLFYSLSEKFLSKIPLAVRMCFFFFSFSVSYFFFPYFVEVPHLYMLGFYDVSYPWVDYFPLLPWVFLFFFGTTLFPLFENQKFPKFFYSFSCKPLEWFGKHSLLIYLFHQPALMGLFFCLQAVGII